MIERIRAASPHPPRQDDRYRLFALLSDGDSLPRYWLAAINLIATACYVILTLLFYGLFKPVSRLLSLIGALFSVTGCIVMTLGFFPRVSLPISPFLFFGPYCLLIGYLIFRSTFLPSVLGVLMALAGLGWLAFLFPAVAHHLSIYIEVLGIFAEASLMLWLIVKSVNVQRPLQWARAKPLS
jgi:Domain of unknown function (DUF4386)